MDEDFQDLIEQALTDGQIDELACELAMLHCPDDLPSYLLKFGCPESLLRLVLH